MTNVADVEASRDARLAVEVEDFRTGYLKHPVVHGISFTLESGKITGFFGHNGAGKSTAMKALAGLLPIYSGKVRLFGEDVTSVGIAHRVRKGLVYLPQERVTFPALTVRDNLDLGAALERDRRVVEARREMVLELFPRLGERLTQYAQTMSGGEQRMVSMGIALMAGAKILMLDEPSLGLAPFVNQLLLETSQRLCREQGLSVLLCEQAIGEALKFVDHVYVMRSGTIVSEYTGDEARTKDDWWTVF